MHGLYAFQGFYFFIPSFSGDVQPKKSWRWNSCFLVKERGRERENPLLHCLNSTPLWDESWAIRRRTLPNCEAGSYYGQIRALPWAESKWIPTIYFFIFSDKIRLLLQITVYLHRLPILQIENKDIIIFVSQTESVKFETANKSMKVSTKFIMSS